MRRCARKPSLKPSITLASLAQATVAVFMAEVLKLPFSVLMAGWTVGWLGPLTSSNSTLWNTRY